MESTITLEAMDAEMQELMELGEDAADDEVVEIEEDQPILPPPVEEEPEIKTNLQIDGTNYEITEITADLEDTTTVFAMPKNKKAKKLKKRPAKINKPLSSKLVQKVPEKMPGIPAEPLSNGHSIAEAAPQISGNRFKSPITVDEEDLFGSNSSHEEAKLQANLAEPTSKTLSQSISNGTLIPENIATVEHRLKDSIKLDMENLFGSDSSEEETKPPDARVGNWQFSRV